MKSKNIIVRILSILFLVLFLVFCFIYFDSLYIRYIIGSSVVAFVVVCVIFSRKNKKSMEILNILLEQCDPPEYIRVLSSLPQQNLVDFFNLCLAYIYMGDYHNALSFFTAIYPKIGKNLFPKKTFSFLFHNNLCYCYLLLNDIARAKQEIEQMAAMLSNNKAYTDAYTVNLHILNMKLGIFDNALQYFQARNKTETTLIVKVLNSYHIAEIYFYQGNPAAAREAANFVIENGNKTVYVSLAQKLLAEIEHKNI